MPENLSRMGVLHSIPMPLLIHTFPISSLNHLNTFHFITGLSVAGFFSSNYILYTIANYTTNNYSQNLLEPKWKKSHSST